MDQTNNSTLNHIDFLIDDRPVAIYGSDLKESSMNFMRSLDSSYWDHLITLVGSVPLPDCTHSHISFLRLCLSQAEEQLFALICAYLQAPFSPDLWLYHYQTTELKTLVNKIVKRKKFSSRFKIRNLSWTQILSTIFHHVPKEKNALAAAVIQRLAEDFVSKHVGDEYNGMKHSMRLQLGGHSLSFAPAEKPYPKPKASEFISLGDSKFGGSFLSFDKIEKGHFIAQKNFSNWDPNELYTHLCHTSLLIGNMGSAFRIRNELEGNNTFNFYSTEDAYTNNPRKLQGLTHGKHYQQFNMSAEKFRDLEKTKDGYYTISS